MQASASEKRRKQQSVNVSRSHCCQLNQSSCCHHSHHPPPETTSCKATIKKSYTEEKSIADVYKPTQQSRSRSKSLTKKTTQQSHSEERTGSKKKKQKSKERVKTTVVIKGVPSVQKERRSESRKKRVTSHSSASSDGYCDDDEKVVVIRKGRKMVKSSGKAKFKEVRVSIADERKQTEDSEETITAAANHSTIKKHRKQAEGDTSMVERQKDMIEGLKKQVQEYEQELQDRIDTEQLKADQYFLKAEKYKVIAKDYRNEIDSLRKKIDDVTLEKERLQIKDDSRKEEQEQLKTQQAALLQEVLIKLQTLSQLTRNSTQSHEVIQTLGDLFQIIQVFANISSLSCNSIQDNYPSLLEYLREQIFTSATNSQHNEKSQHHPVSSDRYVQSSSGNTNHSYQHSIFSPQFMVSSTRQALHQTQPQHPQQPSQFHHHMVNNSSNINQNESSAMENFTLTWDQSSTANQQQQIQQNGGGAFQKGEIEMLVRIQQEVEKLRDDSQKIMDENMMLKGENNELARKLEEEKGRNERRYNEAFESFKEASMSLRRRLDELQFVKNSQDTDGGARDIQAQISEMKEHMNHYEEENSILKEERQTLLKKIKILERQSIEKSHKQRQQSVGNYIAQYPQNHNFSSNEESINLQSYADGFIQRQTDKSFSLASCTVKHSDVTIDRDLNTSSQPYIITNDYRKSYENHSTLPLNEKRISSSKESFAKNKSRKQQKSQTNLLNESCLYVDTIGNQEDKENLFSLSSSLPDKQLMKVQQESVAKESFAPKQLDFNYVQTSQTNSSIAVPSFSMLPRHKPSHSRLSMLIMAKEGQSQEDTSRDRKSSIENSNLSQSNMPGFTRLNHRSNTQESSKVEEEEDDRHRGFNQTQYQNLNYIETDQSFDKSRQSNYNYLQRTQEYKQEKEAPQSNGQYNTQEQLFSKATTTKQNSARRSNGISISGSNLNQTASASQMSNLLMQHLPDESDLSKPKSPTFNSTVGNENINSENAFKTNYQSQDEASRFKGKQVKDFNMIMLNGSGSVSEELSKTNLSNNMSVRTLNLKKEILSLDQEILMLQNNLKSALLKKGLE